VLATASAVFGGREVLADRAARRSLDALGAGDRQAAIDKAERAVDRRADVLRYRLVAAEAWAVADTVPALRRALAHVEEALDTSPRDPIVLDRRAELVLQMAQLTRAPGDWDAAVDAYAALVADDPVHAERQLRYGIAAVGSGDPTTAERAWTVAADLAPRSSAAPVNLARLYLTEGRLGEARAAAERALAREPDDGAARAVFVAVVEAEQGEQVEHAPLAPPVDPDRRGS
jgi:tetratricopeptide (TPR) repeat protein